MMVALASLSSCNTNSTFYLSKTSIPWHPNSYYCSGLQLKGKIVPPTGHEQSIDGCRLRVLAASGDSSKNTSNSKGEEDGNDDPSVPSWAKPGSDETPPWARQEAQKETSGFEVPFYVYLLASAITAIAAIGSAFEYVNQKPVFGVLNSDSIFYAPLLGFFAFTGIPSSAFLWFKSVQVANKEAEEQDRRDGYL